MLQQRLELAEEVDEFNYAIYTILKPENTEMVWSVEISYDKLIAEFGKIPEDILVTITTDM